MSGLPTDKHHGVGFFVSPQLRLHVTNFIPHSPRIAEITLHTLPHPITILNVYAPSMVDDPEKDRDRKADFWIMLEEIAASHSNLDHLIVLGDLNARLDTALDKERIHIGPTVVGQRISVPDADRENAVYLLDFLQANNFILPETFADLPFKKKVTYKEVQCSDPLISQESVQDWTALDHVAVPPKIQEVLTVSGSIFQQLVNSRHLPLSIHLRTKFLPIRQDQAPPKRDFRLLASFYDKVEYPEDERLPVSTEWTGSWGRVKSDPQSIEGLSVGSNNTGELHAVIELFDYLLYYSPMSRGDSVVVYTDSQYVLSLLQGSSLPTTHPQLVSLAQQYYTACRAQFRLPIQKVPGHHRVPGNELADRLAKRAVTSTGSVGRYSATPSRRLQPPDIGFNSHSWNECSVEDQDKFIVSHLTDNLNLIPHFPLSAKKPWISEDILQLIAAF